MPISVCSTYRYLASEFDHIRKIGVANSYVLSFIEQKIAIGLSQYLQNSKKQEKPQILGCQK